MTNSVSKINLTADSVPTPKIKVLTGGKEVLIAGSVFTADSKRLTIQISDLKFLFDFQNDDGAARVEAETASNTKELVINLFNFNSSSTASTNFPVNIGTYNKLPLWLHFALSAHGPEKLKLFHYTFLIGE